MKLIKFEQPNCQPCKMVGKFLDEQNANYQVVNAWDDPEAASDYGVMNVPQVILIDDEGKEIQRSIGFKPEELKEIINQYNS